MVTLIEYVSIYSFLGLPGPGPLHFIIQPSALVAPEAIEKLRKAPYTYENIASVYIAALDKL